jgi:hypothetical protein
MTCTCVEANMRFAEQFFGEDHGHNLNISCSMAKASLWRPPSFSVARVALSTGRSHALNGCFKSRDELEDDIVPRVVGSL